MLKYDVSTPDGIKTVDKVEMAISRLRNFEPAEGYWLAFSGGKDSQCIYHLAKRGGGVRFEAHYSVTSVDPPELIHFIKTNYPDVHFDIPRYKDGTPKTMWNLIPKQGMPPLRMQRYCCRMLKESSGKGHVTITGVRWAESSNRKQNQNLVNIWSTPRKVDKVAVAEEGGGYINKRGELVYNMDNDVARRMVETCYRTSKTMLNPIIDWEEEDVWEYLNEVEQVPHCQLYDEGYTRLGCIGCPASRKGVQEKEFERWPKYRQAYVHAFERMLRARRDKGRPWPVTEETGEAVMEWWLGNLPPNPKPTDAK